MLRRYLSHDVSRSELVAMERARYRGYPVPRVYEVAGRDMVMERIDGRTMLEVIDSERSELDRNIRLLAALHERLHAIEAPLELQAIGRGTTLLHLDLHPANVILSPAGPYVIDWTNAARGDAADDVAQTIAIVWAARADDRYTGVVEHFVEMFVRAFDRDAVRAALPAAIARRLADQNVTDAERATLRDLTL